ncbi:MAG: 4-hydroxythreonine-4-phosphate dehydrogenase PdxA [Melioribacteraceae bacterium]|nr:4-hydroxythreonine-4-phosphate dehydrogenase PdxA [Melioribacteraceae bacterium]
MKTAITCGDVNGIGPELILKALNKIDSNKHSIFFIIPKNVLEFYSEIVPIQFSYKFVETNTVQTSGGIFIFPLEHTRLELGVPTAESGRTSFQSIKQALELFDKGIIESIVTAPISKKSFEKVDINFPGHTELLADHFGEKNFGMFFAGGEFNTALLTIHVPLKQVSNLITYEKLDEFIQLSLSTLKKDFGIASPKIALLGLNPHAGENGVISDEEENIFKPVIQKYISKGVEGPFVPDAFFGLKLYKKYDLIIGCYHDQVLIPFKMMNFSSGVNFTAGLPVVRTSPDHGTAFDIAGKGIADERSFLAAFNLAETIVSNRKLNNQ